MQLRAERKAGEFLKNNDEIGKGKKSVKLKDLGIEENQSTRWQLEAKVSEKRFDEWIAEAKEKGSELTAAVRA